jgi:hypothetical protein
MSDDGLLGSVSEAIDGLREGFGNAANEGLRQVNDLLPGGDDDLLDTAAAEPTAASTTPTDRSERPVLQLAMALADDDLDRPLFAAE